MLWFGRKIADLEAANEKQSEGRERSGSTADHDFPSENIWSIYNSEASKWDRAMVEGWNSDMDGILIFAGLFSATVTAFIIENYKYFRTDPGDLTNAHLVQISQQLLNLSLGQPAVTSSPAAESPLPMVAVAVNLIWTFSLASSLLCALAATLVKQWARNYLNTTHCHATPYLRARVRSYLFDGLHSWSMDDVVEAVPFLFQSSLGFFFVGLTIFLLSVNVVACCAMSGICIIYIVLHLFLSLFASSFKNVPYVTAYTRSHRYGSVQLSSPHLPLHLRVFFRVFKRPLPSIFRGPFSGLHWMTEAKATDEPSDRDIKSKSSRDQEAVRWTLQRLVGSGELEPFVEGIAGFLHSRDITFGDAIMLDLLEDKDLALGSRIGLLLDSCNGPLAPITRQRRAAACITAIWSLTVSALPTAKIWHSGFNSLTLERLERRLTDDSLVIVDWAKCTLAVVLCRVLQDMWNSGAGAAGSALRRDVDHLLKVVKTIQRCADVSSAPTTQRWEALSTRVSLLLDNAEAVEPSGVTTSRQHFVQLLSDARLLSIVDLVVVLTQMSFDPLAFMKQPSRSAQKYTPFSPTGDSQYQVLRYLRRDLSASSRDPDIQACLVKMMGETIDIAEGKGNRKKIHPVMMDDLLVLVGTIDDPGCLDDAKDLVQRYQTVMPKSVAAVNALKALNERDVVCSVAATNAECSVAATNAVTASSTP